MSKIKQDKGKIQMRITFLLFFCITSLFSFSSNNIQFLYGDFKDNSYLYDVKGSGKYTLTYEHFNTHSYGDFFLFIDYAQAKNKFKYQDKKSDLYSEIAPRFSLSKLFNYDFRNRFIADTYLATEYNHGDDYYAYLYGIGFDLNMPLFDMFSLNIYHKNQSIGKNTYQITAVYKSFIDKFEFSGYLDLTKYDLTTQNQLLYDVGKYFNFTKNRLKVGTEWHHFKSKMNDEKGDTFQGMIKFSW